MRQREMPALGIEQVEIELAREIHPQLQAGVVELHALGREVVRTDDGGVARGVAATEIALFEHDDVADAMIPREVVRGREAMTTAADDHHVRRLLEPLGGAEHARLGVGSGKTELQQAMGHRKKSCVPVNYVAYG